jgi:hypothetical protein
MINVLPVKNGHQLGYEWFRLSEDANLILSFKGDFNQELISALVTLAEKNSNNPGRDQVTTTRLLSVIVECLQNICKHAASSHETGLKPGIILVAKTENDFIVNSGNMVSNTEAENLKVNLSSLKKLTKEELKEKHKQVLSTTKLTPKSGAGLGFIGIFRKTDAVDFTFKKINESISFFALQITINKHDN